MNTDSNISNLRLEIHSTICNSVDNKGIELTFHDKCDINLNIEIKLKRYHIFYGKVLDPCGNGIGNILIHLIKFEKSCGFYKKKVVASAVSCEDGSFNIVIEQNCNESNNYKLEISQVITCKD